MAENCLSVPSAPSGYAELRAFTEAVLARLAEITFDPSDPSSIAAALRRARAVMAREAYPLRYNRDVEETCRLMHDEITNRLLAHGDAAGMSRFELFALRRTWLWFLPYRVEHDPGPLRSSEIPPERIDWDRLLKRSGYRPARARS